MSEQRRCAVCGRPLGNVPERQRWCNPCRRWAETATRKERANVIAARTERMATKRARVWLIAPIGGGAT